MSGLRTLIALTTIICVSNFAYAGNTKLNVCHIPPSDPFNFHTVTISEKAVVAHQSHGDLIGECDGMCAELCDDGDVCTIDDRADCETEGCPIVRDPVDCDDSNACTVDRCDPIDGCINEQEIVCEPSDLCHVSACDPVTGACAETAKICGDGESCNTDNGLCEPDGQAPVISNYGVASVGSSTIVLEWTTDIPAASQIYLRLEGVGSYQLVSDNSTLKTEHLLVAPDPLGAGLPSNTNHQLYGSSTSASGFTTDAPVLLVRTRR